MSTCRARVSRNEHEAIRERLNDFHEYLTGTLYRVGALDDRQPQRMILRDILCVDEQDEVFSQLAPAVSVGELRLHGYNGGVMLIHPALADRSRSFAANETWAEF